MAWTNVIYVRTIVHKKDFYITVNVVHSNQDSNKYLPYPESKNFVASLKANDYHVTIARHRSSEHRKPTERWLNKLGLVYDELHLSFHKTNLFNMITYFVVDDAPDVLKKAVESGPRRRDCYFYGIGNTWIRDLDYIPVCMRFQVIS